MNPESFDTIMTRNNTTLPQNTAAAAGSDEKDAAMRAYTRQQQSAGAFETHRKNTALLAVAFSVALLFCLLSTAGAAAIDKVRPLPRQKTYIYILYLMIILNNCIVLKKKKRSFTSALTHTHLVLVYLFIFIFFSFQRAAPSATNTNSQTAPVKTCHQNTPCGWAIYIPFTRRIDYFMKNT